MHRLLFHASILLTFAFSCGAKDAADSLRKTQVIVIPVEGTVNTAMAAFISRSINGGCHDSGCVFILEMDTYGGEVDAAFRIVDTLVAVRKGTTIAYVKTKAISAGALIALACDKLVMKKSTTIGDVAPLMVSNEGPTMLGEKFQSPIRAKFRTLARRNGYPEALTESMVSARSAIYKVQFPDTVLYLDSTGLADLSTKTKKSIVKTTTVVQPGELLTMDDAEAHEFGFSKGSVGSFEEMLGLVGLEGAKVTRIERNWSEILVGFIAMIAPVLMMIGFAALYIELRTPGFGAPGVIGIICLAAVFLSQHMVGLADYTELLLFVIGSILLAIEVFVLPGFGIAGFAGIATMLIAMVLSLQDFVLPRPEFPWEREILIRNIILSGGSLLGAVVIIVLFFRFAFPRLGAIVSGPYLAATLGDAHASDGHDAERVETGENGVAVTPLRPAGKAEFGSRLLDVVAEGTFIEKGESVTVIEIAGNRVVVTKKEET